MPLIARGYNGMGLNEWSMSVNAFHEKAGRSQVGSSAVLLDKVFLRRVATVAILPSALFNERFVARCKLGVLVTAGAAT